MSLRANRLFQLDALKTQNHFNSITKLQNGWPRQDLNLHLLIDQGGNRTHTSGPRDDQCPP